MVDWDEDSLKYSGSYLDEKGKEQCWEVTDSFPHGYCRWIIALWTLPLRDVSKGKLVASEPQVNGDTS